MAEGACVGRLTLPCGRLGTAQVSLFFSKRYLELGYHGMGQFGAMGTDEMELHASINGEWHARTCCSDARRASVTALPCLFVQTRPRRAHRTRGLAVRRCLGRVGGNVQPHEAL